MSVLTSSSKHGKFALRSFVAKDMRNYSAAKFFIIDRSCAEDGEDDFIIAIQSFQMMFSARIIIILSGFDNLDAYMDRLFSIGIYNIITAETQDEFNDELMECFSENGMQKYIVPENIDEPEPTPNYARSEDETPIYKWNARNIHIAIAGTQHKCGITVTAFNMAAWLMARDASVCYVEYNENRHLQWIVNMYGENVGDFYSVQGVDCYAVDEIREEYNFIIYDCGNLLDMMPQVFREADVRLLCGGLLPYEMPNFAKAVSKCKGLSVQLLSLEVPEEVSKASQSILGGEIINLKPSHDLFNANVNGHIYMSLVNKWIV